MQSSGIETSGTKVCIHCIIDHPIDLACLLYQKLVLIAECRLPPTYQTFFQLHLLYVLILTPRLRALPASAPAHSHPIPEHATPDAPTHSPAPTSSSGMPNLLAKPLYDGYISELVNHFFELAESQMRRVLGRGERERIVKKYMGEMGEQWRGAGAGLDYALGLQTSSNPEEFSRSDAELASWLWRNLFAARGLGAPAPGLVDPSMRDEFGAKEVELPEQLDLVVKFIRREMERLDRISHQDVIDGNIGTWGAVQDVIDGDIGTSGAVQDVIDGNIGTCGAVQDA